MSKWINVAERAPKHNQWIVTPFMTAQGALVYKTGQFDSSQPVGFVSVDRIAGKYAQFTYWKPLTPPKGTIYADNDRSTTEKA